MTLPIIPFCPMANGYGRSIKETSTLTETVGGRPRVRTLVLGASRLYTLTWFLNYEEWRYFERFFKFRIAEGGLPFQVDLWDDGAVKKAYVAQMLPGDFDLAEKTPGRYIIVMRVDAYPVDAESREDAEFAMDVFEAGLTDTAFNDFARLANETMLRALA